MEDLSKYKGNSHNQRDDPLPPSKPKVERVVSTPPRVRKRGAWSRVRSIFFEEDVKSIGAAVFDDVIVPKLKDLFYDVVTDATHRSLYRGGSDSRRDSRMGRSGFVPYNRPGIISSSRDRDRDRDRDRHERPALDRRDRSMHDFSAITFPNAGEAEAVADRLVEQVREYGLATVSDFYDSIGLTADFTDDTYGWTDLRGIKVRRIRDGYILALPRPEQLDK